VKGGWTGWNDYGPCCDGFKLSVRACTNPPPTGSGSFCAGPSRLSFTCSPVDCVNDGWGPWSEYGPCCYGKERRTRECLAAGGCDGLGYDLLDCDREVDECYAPNMETGICDVLPFESVTPETFELAEDCCQSNFPSFYEQCMGSAGTGVDGGWSEWTEFGQCCFGSQARFRTCNNPPPSNGGKPCEGSFTEDSACSGSADLCDSQANDAGSGSARVFSSLPWCFGVVAVLLLSS
jgi:hypothetical protein